MRRSTLHSAVMEVGLFYEKGWSRDRIARFTFRLQRRRQRAMRSAQAQAIGPMVPGLMASFAIDGEATAIPIEVTEAAPIAEAAEQDAVATPVASV